MLANKCFFFHKDSIFKKKKLKNK
jgi:hypothetical protein